MLCVERYFPNVGWRWVGGNHHAHLYTLKIMLVLFEYGFYTLQDMNKLLIKLYSISEILFNLENYIRSDSVRLGLAFRKECTRICS